MLKTLRTLAVPLALLLATPACAKQPKPASNDADPALWVVKDHDTTIYLFGTIHVLKPGLTWFDEAVKKAFDASDQVMLELVMPDAQAMQAIVMAHALTPAGTPALTDRLPEAKRAAFARELGDVDLPPNALDRVQPWYAATTLSILPLKKLGYDPANGPEQVITAAAAAEHKPVAGLETAEQQIGYFAALSDAAQMQFLSSTIDEYPQLPATMATMVKDWSAGQPDALAKLLNDDLDDSPEVKQTLLVNRNKNWAQWIKTRLDTPGTVFIAVGAGHLAGKDSVQAQLAALRIKARRVKY